MPEKNKKPAAEKKNLLGTVVKYITAALVAQCGRRLPRQAYI